MGCHLRVGRLDFTNCDMQVRKKENAMGYRFVFRWYSYCVLGSCVFIVLWIKVYGFSSVLFHNVCSDKERKKKICIHAPESRIEYMWELVKMEV